jgi:hypothetical protein
VAACSVPDKEAPTDDLGSNAGSGDTSPLETMITDAPPEFSNNGTAIFKFSANRDDAKFECSVDGMPAMPCTSPFSKKLGDGTHSFSVRATDGDGMSDDTPAEHLWSIDTVAPTTTLTESPPAADNSTEVTFRFTSNEMNVTFECSLDNGAFMTCKSGDLVTGIGDGAHAFAVRAKDRAGNVDASPSIHAWSVDTSTPDTTLLSGPVGAVASQSATFEFISPDAGSGATFECALDGAAFAACSSPVSYPSLSMGQHTFAVRVRDSVGNYDPTPATRTFTVACSAPDPTGSLGLLHLDDSGQVLANATGGATGLLGTTDQPETVDPTFTTGRFAGGLAFNATEADVATWPVMAGTTDAPTVELWASPSALPGTRDILVNEDNRLHVRVTAASGSTVQFGATLVEGNGVIHTVVSAPVAADTWHHVLVSLSAPTLRLWVDGARTEIGDTPVSGISFGTLRLGGSYGGAVDEVYIAGAAVTDDEAARGRFCPISGVVY